jgi:penicillin-binding protein 2
VTAVSLLTLSGRIVHLQVAERPAYAARAEANRVRVVPLEAPRGRILDRVGRVLADSRSAYRISLDRSLPTVRRRVVLSRLAALFGVPDQELARRFQDPRSPPVVPAPLADDASDEVVVALRERPEEYPGVTVEAHPRRHYPQGTLAAHVLGTLTGSGPGQGVERTGASGVERAVDVELAGRPGADRLEADSRGRIVRRLARLPPQPGRDVRLTLDLDVQAAAERALAASIMAAQQAGHAAPAGSVVALDVSDGSILALASAPTFDLGALAGPIPADVWRALHDPAAGAPLTNRALQGQYAPGSTFKPVTALAGLETGALSAGTVVDDKGSYRVGGRVFHNAEGRAHGPVDLARALAVSSDVYFYALAERLHGQSMAPEGGPIQAVAGRLGFGRPTGVDIGPEAAGRIPGPAWKQGVHDRTGAFPDPRWYAGDTVNLAIGQGDLLVTPVQLARAYAALATGAVAWSPHVLEGRGTASGPLPVPVAGPEGRAAVLAGLSRAVADRDGTAAPAFAGFPLDRFPVAGKTGTAQVAGKSDTSLFAAIVPPSAPRFVVVAIVEEAGFGSVVAAPVVRQVIEALMTGRR